MGKPQLRLTLTVSRHDLWKCAASLEEHQCEHKLWEPLFLSLCIEIFFSFLCGSLFCSLYPLTTLMISTPPWTPTITQIYAFSTEFTNYLHSINAYLHKRSQTRYSLKTNYMKLFCFVFYFLRIPWLCPSFFSPTILSLFQDDISYPNNCNGLIIHIILFSAAFFQ